MFTTHLKIFFSLFAITIVVPLMILGSSSDSYAGTVCGDGDPTLVFCDEDADCESAGCSDCVMCDIPNNECVAVDSFCQDLSGGDQDNACRVGLCLFTTSSISNPTGCAFEHPGLTGDENLDELCYYCDPPVLAIDTCGNGVCDTPGEDCNNCALDCLTPGGLEICQDTTGDACQQDSECADGDVCTEDVCNNNLIQCENFVKTTCQGADLPPDLCCPAGCQGIPPGYDTCRDAAADGAIVLADCDPDCWPAQECGDIYVQSNSGNPPETCDDGIPGPTAGLLPDGSTISEADCRNPGSTDECTFCGDGIIQPASEDCDGAALGNCEFGCFDCQCQVVPPQNFLVQGSGGFGCALNSANSIRTPWLALFLMGSLVGGLFSLKKRLQ